ncbi:MAG: hypothetical protein RIB59_16735, partial [Rhodospirillales bacterium]
VSETVRGICSGKHFIFRDQGSVTMKGFRKAIPLHEVAWADSRKHRRDMEQITTEQQNAQQRIAEASL